MIRRYLQISIRAKIFFGCISLTLVTVLVGVLSQDAQTKLSDKTLVIYDDAFQSMNYLRTAQAIVLGISRDIAVGEKNHAIFIDQLQSALDALDVAHERAMSPRGEGLARDLQVSLSHLQTAIRDPATIPARSEFQAVEQDFDQAVGVYASDGFRLRRSAEALVEETQFQTCLAILGSIATAILITLLLSRAIVPSIQQAVGVAIAIASGKLDNRIGRGGQGETGLLLSALATMQGSIADKIGRIESLMAQQASSHHVAITAQNARFETALDHMTLGLRMFDAADVLVVENRRFAEMFGTEESVASLAGADTALDGAATCDLATASTTYRRTLADGRTIEVSEEAMTGGGRVVTYEDITERQRAEARLSHMARHDHLTGLPNRVLFREHLEHKTRAARGGGVVSVLCLDLDRFKLVNDTLGHPIGDALLQEAARRLVRTAGEAAMVVRLGGDEFAVTCRSQHAGESVRALAEALISVLSAPFAVEGHHISIGVTIGIAETPPGLEGPDELLKNADLALYAAKAEGRGTYRFFQPDMTARVQARRSLEIDLRAAIAQEQFELYYQPLVSAQTGRVVGFEALLRWHHPERGMVSPVDFIPVAEETGLIPVIGVWVLNQACRDAMDWPGEVKVAVNLSPLQFQYRNLLGDVDEALRLSGLAPTRLELEITESVMLQDSEATLAVLHALRDRNINISMDDFGTGYSSLSYLRQFPFDKIKIDRSFIRDVVESKDGMAIVEAVIQLGRSLRMSVVAEGVETAAQCALLKQAGCQQLQGYLFSRPQPAHLALGIIGAITTARAA